MPVLDALEAGAWLYWIAAKTIVWVPLPVVRQSGGRLHCADSPAFVSLDLSIWYLDGVLVDEQIVMRPETQTISQIDGERNADVRAIRIARYGWPRYLSESGAQCLDDRSNEIEGTHEALFQSRHGERRVVVTCPTGRVFAMGVPGDVSTCEQAANYLNPFGRLSGAPASRIIVRT